MSKAINIYIPVKFAIIKLGQDIGNARKRRRITTALMAERAGISKITLSKIEKGEASVSMAAYASVLFCLDMIERLKDIADIKYDFTGKVLADEQLPKRIRSPRSEK
ncbi:MAG: helix-turn-helix domain-containing protein [Chitinivibrionia bacterium]|nr:helix-turn-helix domain-containing protein [Chitinivibrionia bacterium]